ncbi:uncharacterized protein LOC124204736 [Daphnia pulex]|uniref:uncharacterized protein LOC124204736 n=1 Tax=Daphnia pulex TaxID=6669 RepID=UPI001EDE5E92|nr:uncharacterized protein LOC124204736 [Daphnia pulex]
MGASLKASSYYTAAVSSLVALWLILIVIAPTAEGSISCYTCSSRNGTDMSCEDPFHPAMSDYKIGCMVPKEGHVGKFPANFCVKVVGTVYGTREKLVIRTCTLENMENQCGEFKYEHESLAGCILTCQSDGCNAATKNLMLPSFATASSFFLIYSAITLLVNASPSASV